MAVMHCTHRLPIELDMRTIHLRARRQGPHRGGTQGRGLVVVAHLASLLSIGALVSGLTFGLIAMAKRCIGADAALALAAPAPDDGGSSRTGATDAVAGSSR